MKNKNAFANSVIGLIINLQVFPGIGSLIGGKKKEGTFQIVMTIIAALLMIDKRLIPFGVVLIMIAWLWALFTGVKMIRETA